MLNLFGDVMKADGRRSVLLTALQSHVFAVIPAPLVVYVQVLLSVTDSSTSICNAKD